LIHDVCSEEKRYQSMKNKTKIQRWKKEQREERRKKDQIICKTAASKFRNATTDRTEKK